MRMRGFPNEQIDGESQHLAVTQSQNAQCVSNPALVNTVIDTTGTLSSPETFTVGDESAVTVTTLSSNAVSVTALGLSSLVFALLLI